MMFKFRFLPFYSPKGFNLEFKNEFRRRDLVKIKVRCNATVKAYLVIAVCRSSFSASLSYNNLLLQISCTDKT